MEQRPVTSQICRIATGAALFSGTAVASGAALFNGTAVGVDQLCSNWCNSVQYYGTAVGVVQLCRTATGAARHCHGSPCSPRIV